MRGKCGKWGPSTRYSTRTIRSCGNSSKGSPTSTPWKPESDGDVTRERIDAAITRRASPARACSRSRSLRFPAPQVENNFHTVRLNTPLQKSAWEVIVAHSGRPVTTKELAKAVGLSREHLSRNFAKPGAPNLKRVIDLVRLIAAAELAKNPGHDIRDIARILDFASSSHLAVTAQRIFGTRPASLARLRTTDLIDRFAQGRTRSRT